MYPHRIRLRDPWETEPLGDGQVRLRRAFNLPTSLDVREHVWLVMEGAVGLTGVTVNGRPQPLERSDNIAACDITSLLESRNFAELTLAPGGSRGEVRLEIRLHDLAFSCLPSK